MKSYYTVLTLMLRVAFKLHTDCIQFCPSDCRLQQHCMKFYPIVSPPLLIIFTEPFIQHCMSYHCQPLKCQPGYLKSVHGAMVFMHYLICIRNLFADLLFPSCYLISMKLGSGCLNSLMVLETDCKQMIAVSFVFVV